MGGGAPVLGSTRPGVFLALQLQPFSSLRFHPPCGSSPLLCQLFESRRCSPPIWYPQQLAEGERVGEAVEESRAGGSCYPGHSP